MASLPYVTAPGNVEKTLAAIKSAATPEAVNQDFVKTILGIKGGLGNQMTAYLKKIGFANPDGKPTDLYRKFRNATTEGWAAAQALKVGYSPLTPRVNSRSGLSTWLPTWTNTTPSYSERSADLLGRLGGNLRR